jgi:hypothetical protein
VPIVRINNCIYAPLGICHSVWMSVMHSAPSIPDSHPHRVHQVGFVYKFMYKTCFEVSWSHFICVSLQLSFDGNYRVIRVHIGSMGHLCSRLCSAYCWKDEKSVLHQIQGSDWYGFQNVIFITRRLGMSI